MPDPDRDPPRKRGTAKKAGTSYRHVKVPETLLRMVDGVVEAGTWGYRSPAEFVVEAIRRRLEELGLMPGRKSE